MLFEFLACSLSTNIKFSSSATLFLDYIYRLQSHRNNTSEYCHLDLAVISTILLHPTWRPNRKAIHLTTHKSIWNHCTVRLRYKRYLASYHASCRTKSSKAMGRIESSLIPKVHNFRAFGCFINYFTSASLSLISCFMKSPSDSSPNIGPTTRSLSCMQAPKDLISSSFAEKIGRLFDRGKCNPWASWAIPIHHRRKAFRS